MIDINNIFRLSELDISFEQVALETFRFQAQNCAPYREYIERIEVDIDNVNSLNDIPYMPIELFKWHDIYCGDREPEMTFTSSNTGGTTASRHLMYDLKIYERAFLDAFKQFYGAPQKWSIYALLPSYLEREGSSLIYMVDRLIEECGSGGFFLYNHQQMLEKMRVDSKPKILLGVSYALWELAEGCSPKLEDTIVMETGGMKGQREELPKSEFHKILCDAFGVDMIHSEYGMAELTSQAYSNGKGIFSAPPWMKVVIRDINDPFDILESNSRGGVNIIDLANRYSCSFIQTQDVGKVFDDGSFEIEGRIDYSDIRGCNLLVQ